MTLRRQVLRGGLVLAMRQSLGVVVGVIGVLLLTRSIGPGQYGLFAAALGLVGYLQSLSTWGVNVYLIRREEAPSDQIYDVATTLLFLTSAGVTLAALLALPLIEAWLRIPEFGTLGAAMFVSLPVVVCAQVPLARLERALEYGRVATIELTGQLVFYLVALPFAYRGVGAWAPVVGWWAQQVISAVATFAASRYRPRVGWNRLQAKEMAAYGLGFSASTWVWQLRNLVNPMVVGRYLGAEAMGYVALTIRIVDVLSFVKAATWRLSIAALGQLRREASRFARIVVEGMQLQVLAVGPILVAFGVLAPMAVPRFFGARWQAVPGIYPYIALSYLANSLFNLHSSALYVLRRNWDVTLFHWAHVFLFAGAALLLVPRLGVRGYGMAEIAALPSYLVIQHLLVRQVGRVQGLVPLCWGLAFGVALFASLGHWWLLGALPVVLLWPSARRALVDLTRNVVQVLYAS